MRESSNGPEPGVRPSPFVPLVLVSVVAIVLGLLAWSAFSTRPRADAKREVAQVGPAAGDEGGYVGAATCAECHAGEAALFARSGHARTLRPIAQTDIPAALDGQTVPDPERPGVSWTYAKKDGSFEVIRTLVEQAVPYPIDYAVGSGRHASTFVSVLDATPGRVALLEHRLSYYHLPERDESRLTPGHEASAPRNPNMRAQGRLLGGAEAMECLNCHATRTSAAGPGTPVDLPALVPNVSCERCHGPGREHVNAARKGLSGLALAMRGGPDQPAHAQMKACGDCHNHPDKTRPGEIDPRNGNLARFQPVGLMQSRCFTKTQGGLACNACHDPHDRPSTVASEYEATCLSCHGGPKQAECKVSAHSGCIGCHMPKVDTAQHIPYTDHWIRIFQEKPAPAQPIRPVSSREAPAPLRRG